MDILQNASKWPPILQMCCSGFSLFSHPNCSKSLWITASALDCTQNVHWRFKAKFDVSQMWQVSWQDGRVAKIGALISSCIHRWVPANVLTDIGRILIGLCRNIKETTQVSATFEIFCCQLVVHFWGFDWSRKVKCVCQIISPTIIHMIRRTVMITRKEKETFW